MRVDFYLLARDETLDLVPRLVARAWPGHRALAVVAPGSALDKLDELLWARPDGRFLPHARGGRPAPIQLLDHAPDESEVLITLHDTDTVPQGRYQRVLEVVSPAGASVQAARRRFRGWQQRGAEVHHHKL